MVLSGIYEQLLKNVEFIDIRQDPLCHETSKPE